MAYSHTEVVSLRAVPNLLEEPEHATAVPTVPELVALLRSTDESERDDALATLAEMVDGAFGEDGAQLGLAMRNNGGVALLSWLLADPSPEVQQMSLMILGNLCSDSVDSCSSATKQALLRSGGARAILSCVHTEDPAVLLFACGALQNLCYEREWSELATSYEVHLRLETLLSHEDPMVVRYASGALQNITRSLHLSPDDALSDFAQKAVAERSLEHRREEWTRARALARITSALRTIPDDIRQARHERGRRRRQRAAQLPGGEHDSQYSRSAASSRPSSAASSRSTGSYVSARSSMTSGSVQTATGFAVLGPGAGGGGGASPLVGRPSPSSARGEAVVYRDNHASSSSHAGGAECASPSHHGERATWPHPPVSPLSY